MSGPRVSTVFLWTILWSVNYLYLTLHLKKGSETYADVKLYSERMWRITPSKEVMYIATEDEYGPWKLLQGSDLGDFLNKAYFTNRPPRRTKLNLTWVEWLYKELSFHKYVSFFDFDTEMNSHARYISDKKREKFPGCSEPVVLTALKSVFGGTDQAAERNQVHLSRKQVF